MNWVDAIILVILAYYAYRGYGQGFISILIELSGYVVAYIIALKYSYIGTHLVTTYFHKTLPPAYETTIGIAVIWTVTMIIYYLLAPFLIKFIPSFISHSLPNKIIGVAGSLVKGVLIVSILVFIASILPLPKPYKEAVNTSYIGSRVLVGTKYLEEKFGSNVTSSINQTISQISLLPANLTSTPSASEPLIHLGYTVQNTTIDPADEATMFAFVNAQRAERHIPKLKLNDQLTQVSRDYGAYMFANGFFSHITPAGQSPLDRVKKTSLSFTYIGENIAKAPDVNAADTGFMNSPEHKANILDPNYTEVGIGVVDGGMYGKMFIQDFIGN